MDEVVTAGIQFPNIEKTVSCRKCESTKYGATKPSALNIMHKDVATKRMGRVRGMVQINV